MLLNHKFWERMVPRSFFYEDDKDEICEVCKDEEESHDKSLKRNGESKDTKLI